MVECRTTTSTQSITCLTGTDGGSGGSSGGGGKVRNKWMKVREDLSIWKLKTCSCNMYVVYITFE